MGTVNACVQVPYQQMGRCTNLGDYLKKNFNILIKLF